MSDFQAKSNPNNSPAGAISRWTVLVLASVVMAMGYVFWDILSPLSTSLKATAAQGGLGWTAAEYGFYAGSYSIFNIFLLMLFFGGIILDKCGIRLTGLMATGCMLAGAIVNYYAIAMMAPTGYTDLPFTLFGLVPAHIKTQVLIASLGFALFGMGCDITGITVSKIITKWFTGHELASAMGLQVALARLGTASALSFSPLIALHWGLKASLFAGLAVLFLAFVLFILYCPMDSWFDRNRKSGGAEAPQAEAGGEERFRLSDFMAVLRNPGFWLIAFLCVFFYSSIRPFMKFATDLMVSKYGVEETTAGWIVAAIPYGTIVLTPLFGSLRPDRPWSAPHAYRLCRANGLSPLPLSAFREQFLVCAGGDVARWGGLFACALGPVAQHSQDSSAAAAGHSLQHRVLHSEHRPHACAHVGRQSD